MIINDIRRMMLEYRKNDSIPSVIRMSQNTFDQLSYECVDLICHKTANYPTYTIYGMRVEIDRKLMDDTMILIGES